MIEEVGPIVAHLTNNEPWYQSRVTWGAIIAAASPILAPIIGRALSPEEQALWTSVLTMVGTGIGAALTLYGRWKARRPIGA
ncbi:hypothetical protein LJD17_05350 [Microvirga rosea]|nr:hypothetical protein [Microvirga rosea]